MSLSTKRRRDWGDAQSRRKSRSDPSSPGVVSLDLSPVRFLPPPVCCCALSASMTLALIPHCTPPRKEAHPFFFLRCCCCCCLLLLFFLYRRKSGTVGSLSESIPIVECCRLFRLFGNVVVVYWRTLGMASAFRRSQRSID